jgi:hypothetical protein
MQSMLIEGLEIYILLERRGNCVMRSLNFDLTGYVTVLKYCGWEWLWRLQRLWRLSRIINIVLGHINLSLDRLIEVYRFLIRMQYPMQLNFKCNDSHMDTLVLCFSWRSVAYENKNGYCSQIALLHSMHLIFNVYQNLRYPLTANKLSVWNIFKENAT